MPLRDMRISQNNFDRIPYTVPTIIYDTPHVSHCLNSLREGYIRDYVEDHFRGY